MHEKNGEFKPEKETPAQKEHQEVVKTASDDLERKDIYRVIETSAPIKRTSVMYPGHRTNE